MIEEIFEDRNPIFALSKVVAGPKKLILTTKNGERLEFQRGVFLHGQADFTIHAIRHKKRSVKKVCSLGHEHSVTEDSEFEMCSVHMEWDQAQALIDWFSNGTWPEVREARKRMRSSR